LNDAFPIVYASYKLIIASVSWIFMLGMIILCSYPCHITINWETRGSWFEDSSILCL